MSCENRQISTGSGNVFADLDFPNPDLALAKASLVRRIRLLVNGLGLTQSQTASKLGIDQPKVSALLRGRVDVYTLDRLFRYLAALGQRIDVRIRPGSTGIRVMSGS